MKKHPAEGAHARARSLRENMTDAERRIWQILRSHQMQGYKFRRQLPIGRYIADFVCHEARLIVEIDGGQHERRRHRKPSEPTSCNARAIAFCGFGTTRSKEISTAPAWRSSEKPRPGCATIERTGWKIRFRDLGSSPGSPLSCDF